MFSEWFSVEQSFRRGCFLAPLLVSILFTAVLNAAREFFCLDSDTVEDISKTQRPIFNSSGAGAKEFSEAWCVKGVFQEVWGDYAVLEWRRHRVAITWKPRKDDGGGGEGVRGVRPNRAGSQDIDRTMISTSACT